MIKEFGLESSKRNELIDITDEIKEIVKENRMKQGLCVVFCPHTTAAITINENADPDVKDDILMQLGKICPFDKGYKHSEGNSDAHVKSSLIGASELIVVEKGKLKLGAWQGIYFAEFDGPRSRKVIVKLLKQLV